MCHGIDPISCNYSNGHLLRQHFLNCLQEGCISPFPSQSIAKRNALLETVNIYCSCRLPYVLEHQAKRDAKDDTKMIYCDCCQKRFHFSCIGIRNDEMTFIVTEKGKEEWICPDCVYLFDLEDSD